MRKPAGRPPRPPGGTTELVPTTLFMVGRHAVRVWIEHGRWTVAVDGEMLPRWFPTQADAWTAAVAEADRIDQRAAS